MHSNKEPNSLFGGMAVTQWNHNKFESYPAD